MNQLLNVCIENSNHVVWLHQLPLTHQPFWLKWCCRQPCPLGHVNNEKTKSRIFTEFSGNIRLGTSRWVILFPGHQLNLLAIQPFACKYVTSFSPVNAIAYQVTGTNAKSLEIIHLVTLPNAIDGPWCQSILNYYFGLLIQRLLDKLAGLNTNHNNTHFTAFLNYLNRIQSSHIIFYVSKT